MPEPMANPLSGASGENILNVSDRISGLIRNEEPAAAPQGQPSGETAPVEANQEAEQAEPTEAPERDESGRFVKRAEPETAAVEAETEEDPKPEGADVPEEEGQEAEQSEPEETEELASTVEGLAEQLGMEADELRQHLTATVKINGDESQVTLNDLVKGHQMEADYRHKTAKIAEDRRTFEADQQAITSQREHFSQTLEPLVKELEGLVAVDQQLLQSYLDQGDLVGFEQAQIHAKQREMNLVAAQKEQGRIQEESAREAQDRFTADVVENERLLLDMRPEWGKDQVKGKARLGEIRQYLRDEGVPGDTVSALYDARSIVMAEKAMMWDHLQAKKPDNLNKIKTVPKRMTKPGPSKQRESGEKKVHRANLNRLRKTGDLRDMAKSLQSAGIITG